MSVELIIVGAVILGAGIILGHFFPNRYWIALIIVGVIIMAIGAILLAMAAFVILPTYQLNYANPLSH